MKNDEIKVDKEKAEEIIRGVYREFRKKEKNGATKSATINEIIIMMEKVLKDAN